MGFVIMGATSHAWETMDDVYGEEGGGEGFREQMS